MNQQKTIFTRILSWVPGLLTLAVASSLFAQFRLTQIEAFCTAEKLGSKPFGHLIRGSDGALYGTTVSGAGELEGTVFRLNPDGGGFLVLHVFGKTPEDGTTPFAELLEGSDGALYGTTHLGGGSNQGTVFTLQKNGTGYRVLHSFDGTVGDGATPFSGVIEGTDGGLYGVTHYGGSADLGTVYCLNRDGTGFRLVHSFTAVGKDGVQPFGGVVEGSDGVLYGTTNFGGANNLGVLFRVNRDGGNYRVLRSFKGGVTDGSFPYGALVEDSEGALYGTTLTGGSGDLGTVFKLDRDGGGYEVLHSFAAGAKEGSDPYGGLIWGADGALYGTTSVGGRDNEGAVFKVNRDGGGFAILHSFSGDASGGGPRSALVRDPEGTLFGVTDEGGRANRGTVFRLTAEGREHRVIHSFIGGGETENPYAGLLEGSDGSLYGVSWGGGSRDQGTVYTLARDGSGFTVLHHFGTVEADGANPHAGLIEASDGDLYGTTVQGGLSQNGTVFRMKRDGSGYQILWRFLGSPLDGAQPYGGLLETADGALYGTTAYGGGPGLGTIFRMEKDGSGYVILRGFGKPPDAASPYSGLIAGSDGFLYGSTPYGGKDNIGSVFRLRSNNTGFVVLHSFKATDGKHAFARLIEGPGGALYGTTALGGAADKGTLFRINKDGTGGGVIHDFTGADDGDGSRPAANASLVFGADGALYGTTYFGGVADAGTIFRLGEAGYEVVYSFPGEAGIGANPYAGLLKGADGALYGTTLNSGLTCGTVFRFAPNATLRIRGNGELTLTGPPNHRFRIQVRDDIGSFSAWRFLTNVTLVTDQLTFSVPVEGAGQNRFYRAELAP